MCLEQYIHIAVVVVEGGGEAVSRVWVVGEGSLKLALPRLDLSLSLTLSATGHCSGQSVSEMLCSVQ